MTGKELVLFDFCDTLVDFQTANAYVNYVIQRKGLKRNAVDCVRVMLNRLHVTPILNRYHQRISVNKSLLLYRLKGCPYDEMDFYAREFYEKCIKRHLVRPVISQLEYSIATGRTVAIVSGGYDIYIKYFAAEFKVPHVLSTSLRFVNKIFSGRIQYADCMGEEKVRMLLAYFNTGELSNVFDKITGYSDSESDLPFFQLCNTKIAVLQNGSIPDWAKQIGAEVIVKNSRF